MAMTCPAGGTVASPVFGQQITATGPYSVTIDYGDGDSYTNDGQHLSAIFSHTYAVAGNYAVFAVLTDAAGRTASAGCSYTWTDPPR
jgi:PKD repeat protein